MKYGIGKFLRIGIGVKYWNLPIASFIY